MSITGYNGFMHYLFELTYTIYPFIRDLALFPIMGMYFLFYQLMNLSLQMGFYSFVDTLARTFFFGVGFIFLQYIASFVLKKSAFRTKKNLRNVFFGMFILAVGWEVVAHFFSETLIVRTVYDNYLVYIYNAIHVLGMGALLFFVVKIIIELFLKIESERVQQLKLALLVVTGLYPFLVLSIFVIEIFIDPIGNPAASRYFVLNAAIKNTCIIDDKQENCPKTLEEIGYIEPQHFKDLMRNTQAHYEYFPESNEYIFVVRYSPIRAVVFSPRLIEEHRIDFWEYEINLFGKDEIDDPPNFEGPWQFDNWDYSRYLN